MDAEELAGIMEKCLSSSVKYGTGITKHGVRKWYNPLRWLKGKMYVKNVSLKEVFR